MRNRYGVRTLGVAMLLALACSWVVAQVGPRYVVELPGRIGAAAGAAQGQVQPVGRGMVRISFQGLSVLTVDADAEAFSAEAVRAWPAADLLLVTPASGGRYHGLAPLRAMRAGAPVIVAEAAGGNGPAWPAAGVAGGPGGPQLYPMRAWDALELRKHGTRLRVTAMPGQAGTVAVAGYLLELGNSRASYRVYLGASGEQMGALAQRLPGADLAVLPARDAPRLLALNRGAPAGGEPATLTAAGYAFTAIRR